MNKLVNDNARRSSSKILPNVTRRVYKLLPVEGKMSEDVNREILCIKEGLTFNTKVILAYARME